MSLVLSPSLHGFGMRFRNSDFELIYLSPWSSSPGYLKLDCARIKKMAQHPTPYKKEKSLWLQDTNFIIVMDNGVSTKSTSQLFFTAHHFWECCLANWVSTYLYILSLNPLPFNSGFSRSLWGGGGWERGDSQTQNTGVLNQSTHWAKVG